MVVLLGLEIAGLKAVRDVVANLYDDSVSLSVPTGTLKGIRNMLGDRNFDRSLSPVRRHINSFLRLWCCGHEWPGDEPKASGRNVRQLQYGSFLKVKQRG
jgi:hypothetical protein